MDALPLTNPRICVLGLGYVGLPLAVAFGVHHDTIGYDLDAGRIAELRQGRDRTLDSNPAPATSSVRQ